VRSVERQRKDGNWNTYNLSMSSAGAARQSFYFQFVTTPTADTSGTTLILHFNSQRYVFGQVGEGTQRAFIERGIGLRKVQNVFLTGKAWRHGGLLGMLLTTADVHAASQLSSETPLERARFNIHGPPGIAHALASARRFIFRTGMPLSVHEYGVMEQQRTTSEPTWADENIQVWALPCVGRRHPTANDSSEESGFDSMSESNSKFPALALANLKNQQQARQSIIQDMFDSDWRHDRLVEADFQNVRLPAKIHIRNPTTKRLESFNCASMSDAPQISPSTKVLVRQPWPGSRWEALPDRGNLPNKAVSYIVRGHRQRGVFEKAKAIALGLRPGPQYSKLVAGESVQTNDGKVITPDMVLGPAKPGRGIAIIDLDGEDLVTDFLSQSEWSDPEIMGGIETFCWIAPDHVLEDHRIQDFIRSRFSAQHIFASPSICPNYLAMESSAASTIRLSRISRDHFPIPIHDNLKGIEPKTPNSWTALSSISGLCGRLAERGLTIQIEPRYQIQEQQVVPFLNTYKVIEEVPAPVLDLARKVAQHAPDGLSVTNGFLHDDDPEIVCLGTGSAVPSKYRNVSATLLKMPGYGYYLFDCGENTLGQLKRFYNEEALKEVLKNLRMIWISHLHADHHLGTLSLLNSVKSAHQGPLRGPPFALIADEAMIDFVRDMDGGGIPATAVNMHHLVCRAGQPLRRKLRNGQLPELEDDYLSGALHIRDLQTTWVSHCAGAQAVSIEFLNGFKISYSGDCRPSKKFAVIGRDSDVLIHEATFEDGLEGDAKAKKHSTTSEALGVAAQMRAKNVILTHFSQRYQKIPVMTHIKPPEQIQFEEGAEEEGPPEPVDGDTLPIAEVLKEEDRSLKADATSFDRAHLQNAPNQMNVCVAFDLMRTRVSQIKDMYKLYPAIEALFESQQKVDSEAATEEKAEAINRSKVKGKKDADGMESNPSKKGEKRKSDSDGEGQRQRQGEQMSKKALKRQQQQRERKQRDVAVVANELTAVKTSRAEDEMKTSPPKITKTTVSDTADSKHLDLPLNVDSESLGAIMDITSQAEAGDNA
jgi:ribonuclease Z